MEDDGPGFDPEDTASEIHVSLKNVEERLELMCGGSLEIRKMDDKENLIRERPNQETETFSIKNRCLKRSRFFYGHGRISIYLRGPGKTDKMTKMPENAEKSAERQIYAAIIKSLIAKSCCT